MERLFWFLTCFAVIQHRSEVCFWPIISGFLFLCLCVEDLWQDTDLRGRFGVELSDSCTCHQALKVFVHWILVLLTNLKRFAI